MKTQDQKQKPKNGSVRFFVSGIPATAGSKRGFPIRRKDGSIGVAMTADNKRSRTWMAMVADEAARHVDAPMRGPVELQLTFVLPRPKSHYRTGKHACKLKPSAPRHHCKRPDVTKLVRCAEDACKGILWLDDSQVYAQTNRKIYGDKPGVWITVYSDDQP